MKQDNDKSYTQKNYGILCGMLEENGWKYEKNEDKFTVRTAAVSRNKSGGEYVFDIHIIFKEDLQLAILYAPLPFVVPEQRRRETAFALACINDKLLYGNFDFDVDSGKTVLRANLTYLNCSLNKKAYEYMLFTACQLLETYVDVILDIAQSGKTCADIKKQFAV